MPTTGSQNSASSLAMIRSHAHAGSGGTVECGVRRVGHPAVLRIPDSRAIQQDAGDARLEHFVENDGWASVSVVIPLSRTVKSRRRLHRQRQNAGGKKRVSPGQGEE
jgi:hypothetical protein